MRRWMLYAAWNLAALLALLLGFSRAWIYFYSKLQRNFSLPLSATLSSKEKRRLQHYFYGVSYLSIIFNTLAGRRRNHREKERFADMAALAAFFDDLSEHATINEKHGNDLESFGTLTDERGIAVHWLKKIENSLPVNAMPAFHEHLFRVFELETRGKQKSGEPLTQQELYRLTAEKGSHSVLLFRALLDKPVAERERSALAQFGALIQLCDDIFDLWSDRQSGIQTLATFFAAKNRIPELASFFETETARTKALFLSEKGINNRLAWAEVAYIVNITRVCLQHYRELLKKHGTLPLNERRYMVVDMENWSMRRRTILMMLKKPG